MGRDQLKLIARIDVKEEAEDRGEGVVSEEYKSKLSG